MRRRLRAYAALLACGLAVGCGRDGEGTPTVIDSGVAERLRALGYVDFVEEERAPGRDGVVVHDADRVAPGVNVHCSVGSNEVRFLDNEGRVLHRMELGLETRNTDCVVEPYDRGRLVVLSTPAIGVVTWGSRLLWSRSNEYHHDFAVGPSGEIHTFSEQIGPLAYLGREVPIADQWLTTLGPDGEVRRRIHLQPLLRDRIDPARLRAVLTLFRTAGPESDPYREASDVFHPNSVELLTRHSALGEPGQALICLRELDLVAVVDLEEPRIVWEWGPGELDRPHQPTVLPSGNLVIFDNGTNRGYSRLVEVDPATREIVWEYRGDPPESFWSWIRGGVQPLANGNLLVTESTRGRVFELTREGDVVWELWNPDRTPEGDVRKQIYRLIRLDPEAWEALRP